MLSVDYLRNIDFSKSISTWRVDCKLTNSGENRWQHRHLCV